MINPPPPVPRIICACVVTEARARGHEIRVDTVHQHRPRDINGDAPFIIICAISLIIRPATIVATVGGKNNK